MAAIFAIIVCLAILLLSVNDQMLTGESRQERPFWGGDDFESYARGLDQGAAGSILALQLEKLTRVDANFSMPVFESFVGLLFVRFHEARGRRSPEGVAAYISPEVLNDITKLDSVTAVVDIVVGSQKIQSILQVGQDIQVVATFEACYTEKLPTGPFEVYCQERWTFTRKQGVVSAAPEDLLRLSCPSCGQTRQMKPDGSCPSCKRVVNRGNFNWVLCKRAVISRQAKPPLNLSGGVEAGLQEPTVYAANFYPQLRAFKGRYPDFDFTAFEKRVENIFLNLQSAWSSQDFDKARPFEMDVLFDSHRYWVDRYRAEGMKNHLEDVKVTKIEMCKIHRDAFYEAITVRIFAQMRDWTTDRSGNIVGGDPKNLRRFSEYWTFLRRTGSDNPVQADISRCPSCGAPLDHINQSGCCHYCQTQIASGNFDWVLNSIDQDEVYGV